MLRQRGVIGHAVHEAMGSLMLGLERRGECRASRPDYYYSSYGLVWPRNVLETYPLAFSRMTESDHAVFAELSA